MPLQRLSCILSQNRAQKARSQVQSIAATPRSSLKGGTPIVVIVDDDPAVCGSLKFSLELEGFGVRAYGSVAELFDAGDLAVCDCFVIDQRMPETTGIELIAKLRDSKGPDAGDTSYQSAKSGAEHPCCDCGCSCCRETAAQ
jgi:PleD family two-component response regulator